MVKTIDGGKVAEYILAAELLDRGIIPCWPSSQMVPYDLIADTGKHKHKLQVKGTREKTNKVRFQFRMKSSKLRRRYTKKDTDFIVLYVFSSWTWYVIPVAAAKLQMTFKPFDAKCKNSKYKEAWHLLDYSLKNRIR